jgi:hypothetical protein
VIYSFYLAMDGQMLQPKKPMMALVVEQLSPGRSWQNLESAWHQALLITWQGSWLDDSEDASAPSLNKVSGFILDA